jgi:hypothetical protein
MRRYTAQQESRNCADNVNSGVIGGRLEPGRAPVGGEATRVDEFDEPACHYGQSRGICIPAAELHLNHPADGMNITRRSERCP